jgi:hypothetical protein
MDITKALGLGIVLYSILFLIGSIVMYILGIPFLGQVLVFAAPLFSVPLAYIYLRETAERQFLESLELGFFWAILAIIFDIAVFVYFYGLGWNYFSNLTSWIVYGELIFFNGIIGGLVEGTKE